MPVRLKRRVNDEGTIRMQMQYVVLIMMLILFASNTLESMKPKPLSKYQRQHENASAIR